MGAASAVVTIAAGAAANRLEHADRRPLHPSLLPHGFPVPPLLPASLPETHPPCPRRPPCRLREQWLQARLALLAEQKAFTRQRDAIAKVRDLPWVRVEKSYTSDSPSGKKSLADPSARARNSSCITSCST